MLSYVKQKQNLQQTFYRQQLHYASMMAIALTEPVYGDKMVAWQRVKKQLKNISEFHVGIESTTEGCPTLRRNEIHDSLW